MDIHGSMCIRKNLYLPKEVKPRFIICEATHTWTGDQLSACLTFSGRKYCTYAKHFKGLDKWLEFQWWWGVKCHSLEAKQSLDLIISRHLLVTSVLCLTSLWLLGKFLCNVKKESYLLLIQNLRISAHSISICSRGLHILLWPAHMKLPPVDLNNVLMWISLLSYYKNLEKLLACR